MALTMDASATLSAFAIKGLRLPLPGGQAAEEELPVSTAQARAMDRFLQDVERRAYKMAHLALRHEADALDVVQEAMLQLVRSYASRPPEEWKPLFFRILTNKVQDHRRRRATRGRVFAWWTGGVAEDEDDETPDVIESAADLRDEPLRVLAGRGALEAVEAAVQALPARQQQAFLLRNVEGLDVAETAAAMGCTEGSVKTHYFRALQALRTALAPHADDDASLGA